ncbi:MAG: CBS domain-containing protein [Calditrichaeota bacterium]|nr:CBS domain-containing protein [Calditrichota bacterium]
MKVKDILSDKGSFVITINQNKTVYEAIEAFAKHKVGSLLVVDNENNTVGIVGARDLLMETLRVVDGIKKNKVKDIMTKEVIVASPDDDLERVEKIMTKNRVRHLPIFDSGKIAGIVSIGDLVKAQLKDLHVENHYLKDYVSGKYPG